MSNSSTTTFAPQLVPYYEGVAVDDKNRVAIVSVERGANKPYAVRDGERLDFFIRIGSESRRADRDTLRRLFQASKNIHFEVTPVGGATWEYYDQSRVQGYFQLVRRFNELPELQDQPGWERLLINNDYMLTTEQNKLSRPLPVLYCFSASQRVSYPRPASTLSLSEAWKKRMILWRVSAMICRWSPCRANAIPALAV